MATTIYLRQQKTVSEAVPTTAGQRDMTTAQGAGTSLMEMVAGSPTSPPEYQLKLPVSTLEGSINPAHFWSERVASQVTISGAITVTLKANSTTGGTVRARVKISKMTYGGSNIETPIGQGDATADAPTANAAYTITVTPTVPVVVAPRERIIVRVFAIPNPTSGSYGTPSAQYLTVLFDSTNPNTVVFTETITFTLNGVGLHLRRTSTIGIGGFMDLLPSIGALTATTAVVNTAASGTKIQWTKTAGGALAEWISPRVDALGWTPRGVPSFGGFLYVQESNASANARLQGEVLRRKPDGTETLVYTRLSTPEFTTAAQGLPWVGAKVAGGLSTSGTDTLVPDVSFVEDDRIVVRLYIVNIGTMAAGFTVTLNYDVNVSSDPSDTASHPGQSRLVIFDSLDFKAEGDPAATGHIEGGLTMGGIGN